ncbi:hypothetical protein ACJJTC_015017 [Scirpophaga incertulas]
MATSEEQQQKQLISVLQENAKLKEEERITIIDDYWKTFKDAHQELVKIMPQETKSHSAYKCKLSMTCRICHKRHHSLLHVNQEHEPVPSTSSLPPQVSTHIAKEEDHQINTMLASHHNVSQKVAFLALVETVSE